MSLLQRLGDGVAAASTTTLRRLRHGPARPGWSWSYETLVGFLRRGSPRSFNAREGGQLDDARRDMDRLGAFEPRRKRAVFTNTEVAGRFAIWVTPHDIDPALTVLYLHGGAYELGSPRSHRSIMAAIANASGARVLGLDYRLAPEHPCPAAIDDALAAWRHLLDAEGLDPSRGVIAGDSAGGGLTLTTLLAARDAGTPLPAAGVCLSPWTDLTVSGESARRGAPLDYLEAKDLQGPAARYAGSLDLRDPRVSPLFADLAGLPPLLVMAGADEVLLDDSVRLAERARAAGVDVTLEIAPGEVHVYPAFEDMSPNGAAAMEQIGAFVRDRGRTA